MASSSPKNKKDPNSQTKGVGVVIFIVMMTFYVIIMPRLAENGFGGRKSIAYTEFKSLLADGKVESCTIFHDEIMGAFAASKNEEQSNEAELELVPFRTVRIEDESLLSDLTAAGIEAKAVKPTQWSVYMLLFILPVLLLLFMSVAAKRIGSASSGLLSVGKSKAHLVRPEDCGVNFDDVAGCEEVKDELREVVQFLRKPDRFFEMGAKIPRGVLLVGPPGTGKTLLARAVAGESKTPFYCLSGSDFVEMFVGVGAARVRDLFNTAKKNSPCIIFIDELDAIGRTRGVHLQGGNDEREQTLNQLLVEMDGFETDAGVIVLAATNRPDVLDKAILRPGRFDRHITVDVPDANGREAILKIHSRGKPLYENVDLHRLAKSTPGFSGADLANLLNEAALLAVRRNDKAISQSDIEEAMEKVIAGPQRKNRLLGEEERQRVAYHEVGHALVAAFSEGAKPVRKISIVPRGHAALGYTLQWSEQENYLQTHSQIATQIRCLLGGRAAEEIVLGEPSNGSSNDLEKATQLLKQMIGSYGMNPRVGMSNLLQKQEYMRPGDEGSLFDCSEETAREIDEEIRKSMEVAYAEASKIIRSHRKELEVVVAEVLKHESLSGDEFHSLLSLNSEIKVKNKVA